MTFFQAFNEIKSKYSNNDLVIYELVFYLSKSVKSKEDFINKRNDEIDFDFATLILFANQYFIDKKPLGHIIKKTKFINLDLDIYDGILVPRNETELLCINAEKIINQIFSKQEKFNLVDLCCGTGNIAVYLKSKFNNANVFAIDVNEIACVNTLHNSQKNNLSINVINGDYYDSIINNKLKFDVIIMNPPYVALNELDETMTKYENRISFINSDDPNEFYYKVIDNYEKLINNKNNFLMAFEISSTQKNILESYLKNKSLHYQFLKDYSGKWRCLFIWNSNKEIIF